MNMDTDAYIAQKLERDATPTKNSRNSHYFAAASRDDIASQLQAKVDKYYDFIQSSNLVDLWRRSYRAYYGMRQSASMSGWGVFDVGGLTAVGDMGEIVRVKINHYNNLITHQLALSTSQRPALECRAINTDAKSLVSAQLGDGIVEYFLRERKIERNILLGVETALVIGEGYVVLGWDETAGKEYGAGPNGGVVYNGDVSAKNFTPFQMVKDVTKNSDEDQTWYITHGKRNRYDMMAKYPDLADQIDKISSDEESQTNRAFSDPSKMIVSTGFGSMDSDDIPYMEFYHAKTDSMPNGRYTIFVNGDLTLFDGPLPFREVPVYRVTPKNIIGTPFGWTIAFDLLGIQELIDKLYTVVSSNVLGSGVNNFWSPPNNNVTVTQLGGNRSLIESMVKPEVLSLLATPAEVYNYINKVEAIAVTISGVSAINRGDLPRGDLSGSAMALLASQAITFSSGLQASVNQLLESVGTGLINILKDFAKTPQLAIIAGKQNRPQMKTYLGEDLEPINNVVCDASNALSKTIAGKIAIADNLLKAGMIKTPEEYITLIKTGQMEPMTRGPMLENFLIQQENEWLLEGKEPVALRTDNHAQHIQEHTSILSTPDSRQDPELIGRVDRHLRDHERLAQIMQQVDPAFLAANQRAPLPFPQQPAPVPQGGNPSAPQLGGLMNPQNPVMQQAEEVRQPRLPSMPDLPHGSPEESQASYEQLLSRG